jgi:hypothetical protein
MSMGLGDMATTTMTWGTLLLDKTRVQATSVIECLFLRAKELGLVHNCTYDEGEMRGMDVLVHLTTTGERWADGDVMSHGAPWLTTRRQS